MIPESRCPLLLLVLEQGENWHKSLKVSDNSPGESPAGLSIFPRSISLIYSCHYPGNPPPLQRHSALLHPSATGAQSHPCLHMPSQGHLQGLLVGTGDTEVVVFQILHLVVTEKGSANLFSCVLVANPCRTGVPV